MISFPILAALVLTQPAQSVARGAAYLQAAVVLSVQRSGGINHRVDPPLSGTVPGLSASGGGYVSRQIAIEGELNLNADLSAPQEFSYFSRDDYVVHNRDIALGANVRVAGRYLDVVGGGGWAFTETQNTDIVNTSGFGTQTVTTTRPDVTWWKRGWSLNGGVDVPVSTGRAQVVATTRVRWTRRPSADLDYVGVGAFTFQFGVGVRLNSSAKRSAAAQQSPARLPWSPASATAATVAVP